MKKWEHYTLTPTRYGKPAEYVLGEKIADSCKLYIGKQPNVGWRFVVDNGGFAQVGSIYKTKDEILADMERYASTWGLV